METFEKTDSCLAAKLLSRAAGAAVGTQRRCPGALCVTAEHGTGARETMPRPPFYSSVPSPPSGPSPIGVSSNQAVRLSLKASMPML